MSNVGAGEKFSEDCAQVRLRIGALDIIGAITNQLKEMAYTTNLRAAARRHYNDGRKLLVDKCYDNAGYHFGFAAECAVKQKLIDCGVRADDNAIWTHWPALRHLGLLALAGRSADPVRKLLDSDSFMQGWDTKMRYAPSGSISDSTAEKWRADADRAVGLLI